MSTDCYWIPTIFKKTVFLSYQFCCISQLTFCTIKLYFFFHFWLVLFYEEFKEEIFFLYCARMSFYGATIFYWLSNYVLITEKLGEIKGRNPSGLNHTRNYRYGKALGLSTVPWLNTSGSLPSPCWPQFDSQCNCLRVHVWQLCVWHWASYKNPQCCKNPQCLIRT